MVNCLLHTYNKVDELTSLKSTSSCGCNLDAKKEVKLYVDTWIKHDLEELIKAIYDVEYSRRHIDEGYHLRYYYGAINAFKKIFKKSKKR